MSLSHLCLWCGARELKEQQLKEHKCEREYSERFESEKSEQVGRLPLSLTKQTGKMLHGDTEHVADAKNVKEHNYGNGVESNEANGNAAKNAADKLDMNKDRLMENREQPPPIPLLDDDECEEISLGGGSDEPPQVVVGSKLRLDHNIFTNNDFSSPLVSSIGEGVGAIKVDVGSASGGRNAGDDSVYNTASISPPLVENKKEAAQVMISPFGADAHGENSGVGQEQQSKEQKMSGGEVAGTSFGGGSDSAGSSSRQPLAAIQEQSNHTMNVEIAEFEKRGDGMNAYIVYKLVCTVSGVAGYADRTYSVWRRFSDFLGLHDKLVGKYLSKGVVVPPTPEKSISAMTKTKTTSDPTLSRDVAVRRCRQLERFIRRVVQHPRMRQDCDVRDFLTLEAELPKSINTSALSSAGVKRMFKTVGEVFNKMAFHMEEGDRWFEQALSHIDELDEALRKLLSLAEKMASDRKELAHAGEMLSKGLSMLASCEESTALSRALSHLTETEENVAAIWEKQSEADTIVFVEAVQEYVGLISSLRDVFDERVRVWQQWQTAQQTLAKKRDQKTKLEMSGRNERVAQIRDEIEEAGHKMDALEKEFGELSKLIREEVARFESQRRADMKKIIIAYLESLLSTHQEILKLWEKFEPETHAIIV